MNDIPSRIRPVGQIVEELYDIRERKRDIEAKLKEVNEEYRKKEAEVIATMQKEAIEKATSTHATVALKEGRGANIEDHIAFFDFVAESRNYGLLYKRASVPAVFEYIEQGKTVPGVAIHTFPKLSMRNVSK